MKPVMQAQIYAQLRADEQEAARVLFGYGESEEQPEAPPPATVMEELIAALQRFATSARRAETTAPVVNDSPEHEIPTPPNSGNLADYLRLLAAEMDKRQAPTPPKAPEAKQRQRVDVTDQLAAARQTAPKDLPVQPAPPPKPAPRAKIILPPPPPRVIQAPAQVSIYTNPNFNPHYETIKNYIQCILLVLGWVSLPFLLWWTCASSSYSSEYSSARSLRRFRAWIIPESLNSLKCALGLASSAILWAL
jgi:hypothetical protein